MLFRIFPLAVIMLAVLGSPAMAQECPCCTSIHGQFDFWLGSWTVYDSLDQEVGSNEIVKAQKECLLIENWSSVRGSTGTSYNYYDTSDSTWNQLWIDDQGGILELKGSFIRGAMVLKSEWLQGQQNRSYYNRITWEPVSGEVIQTWELLNENQEVVKMVFKGFYRKK